MGGGEEDQKAKGKRQKAKGKRQKAKGKRQKAKGNKTTISRHDAKAPRKAKTGAAAKMRKRRKKNSRNWPRGS